VASDAWKSSTSGLLQALESLPGIETGWADEESAQELAGAACDACNRSRWVNVAGAGGWASHWLSVSRLPSCCCGCCCRPQAADPFFSMNDDYEPRLLHPAGFCCRSHATRELILKGVPYQPLRGNATLISNRRLR
jgi:hypothetical protein